MSPAQIKSVVQNTQIGISFVKAFCRPFYTLQSFQCFEGKDSGLYTVSFSVLITVQNFKELPVNCIHHIHIPCQFQLVSGHLFYLLDYLTLGIISNCGDRTWIEIVQNCHNVPALFCQRYVDQFAVNFSWEHELNF